MPFSPEIDIIGWDSGHANTRGGSTRFSPDEPLVHMQSLVAEISEHRYNQLADRALDRGKDAPHLVGDFDGQFYVTGENAAKEKTFTDQPVGIDRWKRNYQGVLFCATMQQLYMNEMPDVVNMYAGHPPKDFENRKILKSALKGSYSWITPGFDRMKVRVDFVAPYDEFVGSISYLSLDKFGKPLNKKHPVCTKRTAIIDIGGGTMDLTVAEDGYPDHDNMTSRDIGGNEALYRFRDLISDRKEIRKILGGKQFPMEYVYEIAMDPNHCFEDAGTEYNFTSEFTEAFTPTVNQAATFIGNFFGAMIGFNSILMVGGTAGQIYDMLVPKVFGRWHSTEKEKNRVYRSGQGKDMMLSNGLGIMRMARSTLGLVRERNA